MFQYANARALSLKNKLSLEYYFDNPEGVYTKRYFELDIFNISGCKISKQRYEKYVKGDSAWEKVAKKVFGKPINHPYNLFFENGLAFNKAIIKVKDNTILLGYWPSEKYFSEYRTVINDDFKIVHTPNQKNKEISALIKASNSVSVHVRRGDYIKDKNTNRFHGTCSPEYYSASLNEINSRVKPNYYFVFSDDLKWVKNELNLPKNSIYIDWNKGNESYWDMWLMSLCKHNIIANSTFSWWGAYLNTNPKKVVIAPKNWFNSKDADSSDIVPVRWIKI